VTHSKKANKNSFPLTRRFALVSFLILLVASGIMILALINIEKYTVVRQGQEHSIAVAEHLTRSIESQFFKVSREFPGQDSEEYRRLHNTVKDYMRSFHIDHLLIFNRHGDIVYSDKKEMIGRHEFSSGLQKALAAKPNSKLENKKEISHLGENIEKNMLETYVSWPGNRLSEKSPAVLEIYRDATGLTHLIKKGTHRSIVTGTLTMGLLYLALIAFVYKAETIIKGKTEELENLNLALEKTVSRRTQELAATREQLEQSQTLATIGTLAAGIAHDINNPLSTISTCAEGLMAQSRSPLDEEARKKIGKYSRTIVDTSMFCKNITFKLLNLARMKPAEKLDFDLCPPLRELASLLRSRFEKEEKNLQLLIPESLTVKSDKRIVQQILLNFLNNACEHTPKGGRVLLGLQERDDGVILKVEDNGTGISREDREKIFDPFFSTRPQGNGLGLAIAKHLADRIAARIDFETGPKGSTFILEIPFET
jgi:signal transduction histidine kinase